MPLEIRYGRIRHEDIPEIDGTITHYVHVPAFIGNNGPFFERFTRDEFLAAGAVEQRFTALRLRLESLPK